MELKALTPGTKLPENVPILFYDKVRDKFELGQWEWERTLWIEKDGYASYSDFTHYYILKKPE